MVQVGPYHIPSKKPCVKRQLECGLKMAMTTLCTHANMYGICRPDRVCTPTPTNASLHQANAFEGGQLRLSGETAQWLLDKVLANRLPSLEHRIPMRTC